MTHPAVRVCNLGKEYRLPQSGGETDRTGGPDPESAFRGWRRWSRLLRQRPRPRRFWALRDVSFELRPGDVVGVVGRNGAGKSTLLKMLSRIVAPTTGRIELWGRVGSLLEVGTGFHPELTGRDNVFLSGAVLGMRRAEIKRQFDDIVGFAEVGRFIDVPVKRYSSGMYLRLAFAVAAHLQPEILLVDEALAVGDAAFQTKCLGKIGDVARQGRTVVFVSHNLGAITRTCPEALWFVGGKLVMQGPAREVVSRYLTRDARGAGECVWEEGVANLGVSEFKVFGLRVLNHQGQVAGKVETAKSFFAEIRYRVYRTLPYCRVGLILGMPDGGVIFETYDSDQPRYAGPRAPGEYVSRCTIPPDLLRPGQCVISINVGMPGLKNLVFVDGALTVDVEDTTLSGATAGDPRDGLIRPILEWEQAA
jgi:lipopolysaccharide transport system ATP-binding protein